MIGLKKIGLALSIFVVSLLLSSILLSVAAEITVDLNGVYPLAWEREYGDGNTDFGRLSNIIQTSDGGYVFADLGWKNQTYVSPLVFYKVNSTGDLEWKKTIDLFGGYGFVQTGDGGYLILGGWNWDPNDNFPTVPAIIKIDSEGNLLWVKNDTEYTGQSIFPSIDGGFVILNHGITDLQVGSVRGSILTKVDSSGTIQWSKTYSEPAKFSYVNALTQTKMEATFWLVAQATTAQQTPRTFISGF